MNQKQRGWKLCWKRRSQNKQIRKVLNMKHQMSNVQDFSCLKMYENCIKVAMNLSVFAI